jgi:hypothetical protein
MAISYYTKLSQPKKSSAYDSYWEFAAKRFEIFEKRILDPIGPWTSDPVIKKHRFTNVFRASDRVSQFLINLQYQNEDMEEVFFKTLLFKIFNKIETYQYLEKELGTISVKSFSLEKYDDLLTRRMASGNTIYSAAYIMPSAGSAFGHKFKHSNHLALLSKMIKDKFYLKMQRSSSLKEVYELLLSLPSFGNFLAFQYAIDLNYSEIIDFSEMDFVVAGPGAKNGISKCFDSMGDFSFEEIIRMMTDIQEDECVRLGITRPSLWGRDLQLIDCQNLFCEVDKYLRVTKPELNGANGRARIKQKYLESKGSLSLFFPPKWNINNQIESLCQVKEDIFL